MYEKVKVLSVLTLLVFIGSFYGVFFWSDLNMGESYRGSWSVYRLFSGSHTPLQMGKGDTGLGSGFPPVILPTHPHHSTHSQPPAREVEITRCSRETPLVMFDQPTVILPGDPSVPPYVFILIYNRDDDCDPSDYTVDITGPLVQPDHLEFTLAPGKVERIRVPVQPPSSPGDYPMYVNLTRDGEIVNKTFNIRVSFLTPADNPGDQGTENRLDRSLVYTLIVNKTPDRSVLPAGNWITYRFAVYDAFGHEVDDYEYEWSVEHDTGSRSNQVVVVDDHTAKVYYRVSGDNGLELTVRVNGTRITYSDNVEVIPGSPTHIFLSPQDATVPFGGTLTFNLTLTDRYGNPLSIGSDEVYWSVSDPDGNPVDFNITDGVLYADQVGSFVLTVRYPKYDSERSETGYVDKLHPYGEFAIIPSGLEGHLGDIALNPIMNTTTFEVLPPEVVNITVSPESLITGLGSPLEFNITVYTSTGILDEELNLMLTPNTLGEITYLGDGRYLFTPETEGCGTLTVEEPISGYTDTFDICVDGTPPDILTHPPTPISGSTVRTPVHVNVSTDEPAEVWVVVDGFATSDLEYDHNSSDRYYYVGELPLLPGEHTLQPFARDGFGNIREGEVIEFNVVYNIPPNITLLSPENGSPVYLGTPIVFEITDDDGITSKQYRWDDDVYQDMSSDTLYVSEMTPGEHNLTVRVVDTDGEVVEQTYQFVFDDYPHIELLSPENGSRVSDGDMILFNITDDDEITLASYSWNDGPEYLWETRWNITVDSSILSPDDNRLRVRVVDTEGFETIREYVFLGENLPPVISNITPENGTVVGSPVNVSVEVNDTHGLESAEYECPDGSVVEVELNSTHDLFNISCDWSYGINVVEITVYDDEGADTEYIYTLILDTHGPNITLISPVNGSVVHPGDNLSFNITDEFSSVVNKTYSWDDNPSTSFTGDTITVPDLEPGTHNLTVTATDGLDNSETMYYQFTVPYETGNITGYVYDLYGSPVSGAHVEVDTGEWTTTDTTGYFVLSDLPEGDYNITASAPGYESQTIINQHVIPGDEVTVTFYLVAYGAINGTVTDWAGNPIPNAVVTVYDSESGLPVKTVESDSDGNYVVDELLPGWYDVEAYATGYVPMRISWRLVRSGETTTVNLVLDS